MGPEWQTEDSQEEPHIISERKGFPPMFKHSEA